MILRNFISPRAFAVYMETHCGLKFHFGLIDQSEICTEVSFTLPEVMWTLIIYLFLFFFIYLFIYLFSPLSLHFLSYKLKSYIVAVI